MKKRGKRAAALVLSIAAMLTLAVPAGAAEIKYMPGVTAEMSDAAY